MAKRPLKKVEKIILIGFATLGTMLVALWLLDKQPNRAYLLPEGFEGWVTIRYGVEGAPSIPVKDGVLQFAISDSGTLETSDPLVVGWRRDDYYSIAPGQEPVRFPMAVNTDSGYQLRVFLHNYYSKDWTPLLHSLPTGTDTLMRDGTRLNKISESEVEYVTGKKTLEYFYVSAQPRSIMFSPPPNPRMEGLTSTEDRHITQP